MRHGGADYRFHSEEIDPPRGRPCGGGGIHRNWGYGGFNPHDHIGKDSTFIGNHLKYCNVPGGVESLQRCDRIRAIRLFDLFEKL
jgi:hypothetical protein